MNTASAVPISELTEHILSESLDNHSSEEVTRNTVIIKKAVANALCTEDVIDSKRDTLVDFMGNAENAHTPLHEFLWKYDIPRVKIFNSRGVSCTDGRKMDVLIKDRGMIVFQYDVPMVIKGKLRGYTRYDLIFSEFTGDCITYEFKDDFRFDTATVDGRLLKLEYCTRHRPDWREIMAEFDREFEKANLY